MSSLPPLRQQTGPVSETSRSFVFFYKPEQWTKPKNSVNPKSTILNYIFHDTSGYQFEVYIIAFRMLMLRVFTTIFVQESMEFKSRNDREKKGESLCNLLLTFTVEWIGKL
jgi:hypothetical protein